MNYSYIPFIKAFKPVRLLGEGSFAKVVQVEQEAGSGRTFSKSSKAICSSYALKIINKNKITTFRRARNIESEMAIMTKLDHPYIAKMYDTFVSPSQYFMLLEFCSGGDLANVLRKHKTVKLETAIFITSAVLLAIEHVHSQAVCFRDLKPENILVDKNGYLKLTDFGLARSGVDQWESGATTMCGTSYYMAPEVFLTDNYGISADYWAIGVIFYECIGGVPPYRARTPAEVFEKVAISSLPLLKNWSVDSKDFLKQILTKRFWMRLGNKNRAKDIQDHPLFADMDWTKLNDQTMKPPTEMILEVSRSEEQKGFFARIQHRHGNGNGNCGKATAAAGVGAAGAQALALAQAQSPPKFSLKSLGKRATSAIFSPKRAQSKVVPDSPGNGQGRAGNADRDGDSDAPEVISRAIWDATGAKANANIRTNTASNALSVPGNPSSPSSAISGSPAVVEIDYEFDKWSGFPVDVPPPFAPIEPFAATGNGSDNDNNNCGYGNDNDRPTTAYTAAALPLPLPFRGGRGIGSGSGSGSGAAASGATAGGGRGHGGSGEGRETEVQQHHRFPSLDRSQNCPHYNSRRRSSSSTVVGNSRRSVPSTSIYTANVAVAGNEHEKV